MIADIILGINIDTQMWIEDLKKNMADTIIVIDYDYYGEPVYRDGVIYMCTHDLKESLKKFDSIFFYKSMYAYPVSKPVYKDL